MSIPMPQAANINSSDIQALCKRLVPDSQPIYLDVEKYDLSIENDCYANVEKVIQSKGGSIQYGWQIWETLLGVMAEAEFHAVWVDPHKKYHDITPKALPGIDRILFLPDLNRVYAGRQIDNIRIALRTDPLISQFIQNEENYFEVMNRGELANYHGEIIMTPEIERILEKKREFLTALVQKYYQT